MKDKLLLHACCAPCSSAIIEHLSNYFDITLYYYNPCITSLLEYNKRADELVRLVSEMKLSNEVSVKIAEYNPDEFYSIAGNLGSEPEGGKRCRLCYAQRLAKSARYAVDNGFKYFSTTLTISPYKNSAVINDIGGTIGRNFGIMYMPFDFGYLYTRSLELSNKYELYQQNYCGCSYSKT